MNKVVAGIIGGVAACILIFNCIYFGATPSGRTVWNNWFHAVQKADDDTNYATRKKVEDTCRAISLHTNSTKIPIPKKSSLGQSKQECGQTKRRRNITPISLKILMCGAAMYLPTSLPSCRTLLIDICCPPKSADRR